jgi:C4-dicarboxylate-specific signal transduction histidine kinase
VPVLIGSAVFEKGQNEGVAFVLDLSGQKSAEEALQKAQTELAHVARVTTLGELTASIAHEIKINQPLAGMVTNANASLRWLAGEMPDLAEARNAILHIVRDGNRATDVITRLRALFKKAPAATEPVDINEVIQEVLAIIQNELQRNHILLRTELAKDLPMVIGDKVQLQQVVLNLMVNAIEVMSGESEGLRELLVSSQKSVGISGEALTESQSASVLVAVRDSGPGLDSTIAACLRDLLYD